MEQFLSFLLYSGAATLTVSLGFGNWRGRLATLGIALILLALTWPPREIATARSGTHLDRIIPRYQFSEFHQTEIRGTPEKVDLAIRQVTASEIRLFLTLTKIRRFGRPGPEGILNAPERQPLLNVATKSGFLWLADDPGQELVVGSMVVKPAGLGRSIGPADFQGNSAPGFAKAVMNFHIIPQAAEKCRLTTETRVFATDPATARRFARYWRVIYPGSSLIRYMWLRAIRQRAESLQ